MGDTPKVAAAAREQVVSVMSVDPRTNCAELNFPAFWKKIDLPPGTYKVTLTSLNVTSGGFPHIKSGQGNEETGSYEQQFTKVGQSYTYVNPGYIAGHFIDAAGTLGDNSGQAVFTITKIESDK